MTKGLSLFAALAMTLSVQSFATGVDVGSGAVTVDEGGVSIGGGVITVTPEGVNIPGVNVNTSAAGVGQTGRVFTGDDFSDSNLSGQSFVGVKFVGVDFSDSDLTSADFTGASFQGVDFSDANLTNANFTEIASQGSDFSDANLQGACFIRARLTGNDFSDATLTGTIFSGAIRLGDDFSGVDISTVVWDGPSACPHGQQASTRPEVTSAAAITEALAQGKDASVDLTVNFEFDSDKIRDKGHAQVLEIANALKSAALASQRIMIEGHTDGAGEDDYNVDLSYRRAITVLRVLNESYQLSPARFEIKGYGESQPVASNDTEDGRALNRRVTLVNLGV